MTQELVEVLQAENKPFLQLWLPYISLPRPCTDRTYLFCVHAVSQRVQSIFDLWSLSFLPPPSFHSYCTGFTPDVKLWEVEHSKAGEFQQVHISIQTLHKYFCLLTRSHTYLPLGSAPLQTTLTGFVSYSEWDIQQVVKKARKPAKSR